MVHMITAAKAIWVFNALFTLWLIHWLRAGRFWLALWVAGCALMFYVDVVFAQDDRGDAGAKLAGLLKEAGQMCDASYEPQVLANIAALTIRHLQNEGLLSDYELASDLAYGQTIFHMRVERFGVKVACDQIDPVARFLTRELGRAVGEGRF